MKFYTNFYNKGNTVFIRGYDNGRRIVDRIEYSPTLYVPSRKGSQWKTIHGEPVEPIELSSIKEARDFVQRYEDVDNFTIYGSTMYAYACLNEHYGKDYDSEVIKIANIDIEVESDDGFPDPESASKAITAITVGVKGHYYVFGIGEYDAKQENVSYIDCRGERRLLDTFLSFWERTDPDIVTGWNVDGFDIPYLINRITKIIGENDAKRLSPAKWIQEREFRGNFGKVTKEYTLVGLSVLDYLQLYKKFTYSNQESYRLDHIAFVELGQRKLDYSEVDNLYQLYKTDYQKFIDYNIRDVELVDKLEDKMKLLDQAMVIAHDAKVNYNDVFTQVRLWDILIHNYLLERNVVIPPKETQGKDAKFAGAYVKDPQVGLHKWVMSFDLNSLYPHLIMQYNVSPDTFISDMKEDITVDDIVEMKKIDQWDDAIDKDKCLTANGFYYDKSKQGFLPEMMELMYNERVLYKQKMIEAQKELEEVNRQLKELG